MNALKNWLKTNSLYIFYQQYKNKAYQKKKAALEQKLLPLKENFYKQFLKQDLLVFDIGANTGNRIQAFLNLGAKVIAIEPQPSCVNELRERFADKIIVEQVGVGATTQQMEMFIANDSTLSSFSKEFISKTSTTRFKNYSWQETMTVPIVTLDSLIEKYGLPVFCKIDVEGFEYEVLKGLHSVIPFLSFEYCIPEMTDNLKNCISQLHSISPIGTFNYSIGETMSLYANEWMSYHEMFALLKDKDFIKTGFGDIYFRSQPY